MAGYCPQLRLSLQLLPFQGATPTAPEAGTLLPPTTRGQERATRSSCQSGRPGLGTGLSRSCGGFQLITGLLFINFLCLYACCHGGGWARCSSSAPFLPQMPEQNKAKQGQLLRSCQTCRGLRRVVTLPARGQVSLQPATSRAHLLLMHTPSTGETLQPDDLQYTPLLPRTGEESRGRRPSWASGVLGRIQA